MPSVRIFVSPLRLLHSRFARLPFLCASHTLTQPFFLRPSAPAALPARNAVQSASSSADFLLSRKCCSVHSPDACPGHFHFLRDSPPAAFLLPCFSPVFFSFSYLKAEVPVPLSRFTKSQKIFLKVKRTFAIRFATCLSVGAFNSHRHKHPISLLSAPRT